VSLARRLKLLCRLAAVGVAVCAAPCTFRSRGPDGVQYISKLSIRILHCLSREGVKATEDGNVRATRPRDSEKEAKGGRIAAPPITEIEEEDEDTRRGSLLHKRRGLLTSSF